MKKLLSALCVFALLLSITGCTGKNSKPTILRSFLAGYEENVDENGAAERSSRVLLNLMSDGTAEFYVGVLDHGTHTTARYSGTYSLGENEELDETITLSYTYADGKTAEVTEAAIVDAIFEMPFYLSGGMTSNAIRFYETAPAEMDGDVYVGYMTKVGGMGPMVYCYSLCLKDSGDFHVSIMQMASVMHVFGATHGTYTTDGENVTFTYDIRTTEGEVVSAGEIAEGTGYNGVNLSTAFNIEQATMRASAEQFIRVTEKGE